MPRYDTLCSGVCQLLSAFYRRTMHKSPTVPASTPTAWMAEGKERMPVPTIALNVVENELSRVQHRDPEGLEATLTPPMESILWHGAKNQFPSKPLQKYPKRES